MLVDVDFHVVMTALYKGPLYIVELTEVQLSAALNKRGRQNFHSLHDLEPPACFRIISPSD
jgi:hypothetical protein